MDGEADNSSGEMERGETNCRTLEKLKKNGERYQTTTNRLKVKRLND